MSATADYADNDRGRERRGRCGWRGDGFRRHGAPWRPIELIAMILGFIVFWPIGLAILFMKFWQRRSGYEGDMVGFAHTRFDEMRERSRANWDRFGGFGGRGPGWGGYSNTGNRAFDEWKKIELERIEEERRKLEAAQREFGEYMAHLRMARDREEFERFKTERSAAQARGESGWKPFDESKPEHRQEGPTQ
ncbi:DUF2852 domain-containing protein [Roseiarcaceae bacterium H3SJ34-1]|uniref:DUF2852 domain-containing protein n=1 Tax=Terripilifer ovatus TaxID=3032367 RepID=UPI003AB92B3C|nr:DUF2852 domain-containing protein [Roseiarcaceae bacterium H3SJ34-1]